jgi:putative transposase
MNQFKRLLHAVWQRKYDVAWCPKFGFRVLKGIIGRSLRGITRQLCARRQIETVEGDVRRDCVHLMVSSPPTYAICEALGFSKGRSTIKILDIHHELKKRYWRRYFWEKNYCVSPICPDEEQIRN